MGQSKALQGIRVLDFTWVAAGPGTTKLLAINGAEVIKVESQQRLDTVRGLAPKVGDQVSPNTSLYFNNMNPDKNCILLDMNTSKGLEFARRLVAISDIVISNFSPRAVDKWGLDYDSLKRIREDIIVIHMPVMGLSGPRRHYAGFGSGLKGITGLSTLMGFEGTIPVGPQGTYPDFGLNPSHAMTAVMAALHYRHRTGRGQSIDLSQYESVVNSTGTAILEYTANGRVTPRRGNKNPHMAPHGVYPCAGEEQWIAIAVEDDAAWTRLCEVAEQPQWAADVRFTTLIGRQGHVDELDNLVVDWTRTKGAETLAIALQKAGVGAYKLLTVEDLFEHDEQMRAREHYTWLDHPEIGSAPVDNPGFRFDKLSTKPQRRAPLVGEHNDYVFHELLGLTYDEMNELILEGVFY